MRLYIAALTVLELFGCFGPARSRAQGESDVAAYRFARNSAGWTFVLNYPRPTIAGGVLVVAGKTERGSYNLGVEHGINFPAATATVLQIEVDAASAKSCRVNFTTALAPDMDVYKGVTFDLQPGRHLYTVDMRGVAAWKETIGTLRFSFLGAKDGEKARISLIRILNGEKIATPLAYTMRKAADSAPRAAFRMGSIFADGMVLQRSVSLPIWGDARPGEGVTVTFRSQKATTVANSAGKWRVDFKPESVGEPSVLSAKGDKDGDTVTLGDVLVGDVWLCAGQSNMGLSAMNAAVPKELRKELLDTAYPDLRVVQIARNSCPTALANDQLEDPLSWHADAKTISAVSWFFGRELQATQHIPIGLVFMIAAGTQIEQWMSPASVAATYDAAGLKNRNIFGRSPASGLYNGMVAPILPFPVRGAIWYQGESNANNPDMYHAYGKALPAFINDWRAAWKSDFPVLLVQLPGFDSIYPPESWAYIRQAQLETARNLKDVGLAVTVDVGSKNNLHPSNKYPVGHRLALLARATVYGEEIEDSGPLFEKMQIAGDKAILDFGHADGLTAPGGIVNGFEISADGTTFVPAQATIGGSTVTVSSPSLSEPVAVRYAWHNWPDGNLINSAGLPASPFRAEK